jgi:hypothetical protein
VRKKEKQSAGMWIFGINIGLLLMGPQIFKGKKGMLSKTFGLQEP